MLVTVLPSAATMPMASTNRGNAMMVSAIRRRSVCPPAEKTRGDTGNSADRENQRHGKNGDCHIEACGDDNAAEDVAAKLIGAKPVVQCRRLKRGRRVARQGIERDKGRPNDRT